MAAAATSPGDLLVAWYDRGHACGTQHARVCDVPGAEAFVGLVGRTGDNTIQTDLIVRQNSGVKFPAHPSFGAALLFHHHYQRVPLIATHIKKRLHAQKLQRLRPRSTPPRSTKQLLAPSGSPKAPTTRPPRPVDVREGRRKPENASRAQDAAHKGRIRAEPSLTPGGHTRVAL